MTSPLVRQVEKIVMDLMADLPPHQPLPRETILAKQIGVSRRTLRNALANLEASERVRRIRRKGTFPTRGHQAIPIFQRRARIVGIVASHAFRSRYRRLITAGAYAEAFRQGYNLILVRNVSNEDIYRVLDEAHVDGLILYGSDEKLVSELLSRKKPICLVDHHYEKIKVDSFETDSRKATLLAMRHLYQWGHRKIGFINADDPQLNPERAQGYEIALRQLKLYRRPELIIEKPTSIEGGKEAVSYFLSLSESKRPTAILTFNVKMALGATKAVYKHGLSIPKNFSVMVAEATPDLEFTSEPEFMEGLTHVTCDPRDIGKSAINRLLERIKNPNLRPQNILVPVHIEIRKSTSKI